MAVNCIQKMISIKNIQDYYKNIIIGALIFSLNSASRSFLRILLGGVSVTISYSNIYLENKR